LRDEAFIDTRSPDGLLNRLLVRRVRKLAGNMLWFFPGDIDGMSRECRGGHAQTAKEPSLDGRDTHVGLSEMVRRAAKHSCAGGAGIFVVVTF
jgi:hypothetical protein